MTRIDDEMAALLGAAAAARPQLGAIRSYHGPIAVTHFGTHARAECAPGESAEAAARAIPEVLRECARRAEPLEWRVLVSDPAAGGLATALSDSGLRPGWERGVLMAGIADVPAHPLPPRWTLQPVDHAWRPRLPAAVRLADDSGPHRVPLTEWTSVGRSRGWEIDVSLLSAGRDPVAAVWTEDVPDSRFLWVGGLSAPSTELLDAVTAWSRIWAFRGAKDRIAVEAGGATRAALLADGFREAGTVRSHHWSPPGPAATVPPIKQLLADPEDRPRWDRVVERVGFGPHRGSGRYRPPQDSFTWSTSVLADRTDLRALEVEAVIDRGLRACLDPGEQVYFQRYGLNGFRYDPARVGGPGQPARPGSACPWGEFHFLSTADARVGTYGDCVDEALCVFGSELLDEVFDDLSRLLGRGGSWSFG